MSDWDQQPYWERHAGWGDHEAPDGPSGRITTPSPPDVQSSTDRGTPAGDWADVPGTGVATDELSGRRLRARLMTTGVTVLLVIGAATAVVALAAATGHPGAGSGPYANPPFGGAAPVVPPSSSGVSFSPTSGLPDGTNTPTATAAGSSPAGSSRSSGPTPRPRSSSAGSVVTGPAAGFVVRVVSKASGRMVAVSQSSTSSGALIVQTASTGAVAQWRLISTSGGCFQLLNVHSGLALDNPDGAFDDGVQMQQWQPVSGDDNQVWCFQAVGGGWYSIRNQASDSLLDVRDGAIQEGAAIQQWSADPFAPNANQSWQLLAVA